MSDSQAAPASSLGSPCPTSHQKPWEQRAGRAPVLLEECPCGQAAWKHRLGVTRHNVVRSFLHLDVPLNTLYKSLNDSYPSAMRYGAMKRSVKLLQFKLSD